MGAFFFSRRLSLCVHRSVIITYCGYDDDDDDDDGGVDDEVGRSVSRHHDVAAAAAAAAAVVAARSKRPTDDEFQPLKIRTPIEKCSFSCFF